MDSRTATRTPWTFWAVAAVSLLWNSGGPLDYVMTKTNNAAYLATATPAVRAWLAAYPWWMEVAWALGVWGAIGGSVLLLARNRLAVPVFAVSLAGLVVTTAYQYASGTMPPSLRTAGAMQFSAALWLVAIALLIFAWRMRARGILR